MLHLIIKDSVSSNNKIMIKMFHFIIIGSNLPNNKIMVKNVSFNNNR